MYSYVCMIAAFVHWLSALVRALCIISMDCSHAVRYVTVWLQRCHHVLWNYLFGMCGIFESL